MNVGWGHDEPRSIVDLPCLSTNVSEREVEGVLVYSDLLHDLLRNGGVKCRYTSELWEGKDTSCYQKGKKKNCVVKGLNELSLVVYTRNFSCIIEEVCVKSLWSDDKSYPR